jgi:hypothetical protein
MSIRLQILTDLIVHSLKFTVERPRGRASFGVILSHFA